MEAQVNVRKHARAHRVQVRLVDVNHGWHVQIDDDGDGFEPSNGGSVPGHLGLTALRKRAQIAGGWWKIESRPWLGNHISFGYPACSRRRSSCWRDFQPKFQLAFDRLASLFQHPLGRGQAGKAPDSGSGNPRFES